MEWEDQRSVENSAKSSQLRFFRPIFSHEYKMSFLFICVEMVVILLQCKPCLPTTGNVDCHAVATQPADHRTTNRITRTMVPLRLEFYDIFQPSYCDHAFNRPEVTQSIGRRTEKPVIKEYKKHISNTSCRQVGFQ